VWRELPEGWAPGVEEWEPDPADAWDAVLWIVGLVCGLVGGFATELLIAQSV
jgi:hypothetical protein